MSRKHFQIFLSRYYKKAGLNGYVYDFSVDYDAIAVDDIFAGFDDTFTNI